jgi:hypothetical protein
VEIIISCNICNDESVSLKSFWFVSQSEKVFIFWNQDNWYVFQIQNNIFCKKTLYFENVHRKFTCVTRHIFYFCNKDSNFATAGSTNHWRLFPCKNLLHFYNVTPMKTRQNLKKIINIWTIIKSYQLRLIIILCHKIQSLDISFMN